jgi:hypothetical protein
LERRQFLCFTPSQGDSQSHDRFVSQRLVFQASQPLFTLRQVWLAVSLPPAPPNNVVSARDMSGSPENAHHLKKSSNVFF